MRHRLLALDIDGTLLDPEGEIRDAQTGELLAEGVDRRREGGLPLDTWAEVDRALAFWANRVCSRLEARAGRQ